MLKLIFLTYFTYYKCVNYFLTNSAHSLEIIFVNFQMYLNEIES